MFAMHKRVNQHSLLLTVKKRCWSVCNRISSWLYLCFYPYTIALWASLQLGNASTLEVHTDGESLRVFILFAPEKAVKLANKKQNRTDSRKLKRTVKYCLKRDLYQLLTGNVLYVLFFGVSAIERSVLGSNANWNLKLTL